MQNLLVVLTFGTVSFSSPLHAAGDASRGEELFRNCVSCHQISSPDGEIYRSGQRSAPNLYGVIGRGAGTENYNYSAGLVSLRESGLVWDEASLAKFIANPNVFLEEALGAAARSKMSFAYPDGAEDLAAYLARIRQ